MEQYALSEEQQLLQQSVRQVARERVVRRAAEIDASAAYPQDMFDLLRELGLFALPFPPSTTAPPRRRNWFWAQ